jgi:hypothetical protein
MNGSIFTLGAVGALAAMGALSKRGTQNVHGQIPDEVVESYSYGKCVWLAIALYEAYGWPIYVEMDRLPDGEAYVSHAHNKHPSGLEIDILGPQTEVDSFGGGRIEGPLDPAGLAKIGGFRVDREKVNEAAHIMRRYVDPALRAKGLI